MGRKILFVLFGAVLFVGQVAYGADDLKSVLARLNTAAQAFKTTSATFEFDSLTTLPVEDKTVQTGEVYYEKNGKSFAMAAHIEKVDGQPVPKIYVFKSGKLQLWEGGNLDQVTTITRARNYEGYLALGFGASGTELAEKWDITYEGNETINGVETAKLELLAKDPTVRKNLPKVTIWMDTTHGVSLKQMFDEGQGQSRTCTYSNFKFNQPLPKNAFTFKTDSKTRYMNQ